MSNVSHLAQGQLQQGQKPHIPTLIISSFLLEFNTSVLQTYSSLAGIVSQDSAVHLLVWSFPFALFAGEERKEMQSSMVDGGEKNPNNLFIYLVPSSWAPSMALQVLAADSLGWIALWGNLRLPHCLRWDPSRIAGCCTFLWPSSLPRQKIVLLPLFVAACIRVLISQYTHLATLSSHCPERRLNEKVGLKIKMHISINCRYFVGDSSIISSSPLFSVVWNAPN